MKLPRTGLVPLLSTLPPPPPPPCHSSRHTPNTAFRHLPCRKDVLNQCLDFAPHLPLSSSGRRGRARSEENRGSLTLRASLSGTFLQTLGRIGYATEGALFISAQLSTDAVISRRKSLGTSKTAVEVTGNKKKILLDFGFICAGVSNVE